jgi:hypothetical protein
VLYPQFRAPVNLLRTGGAPLFFKVRRGRKTFCQSTETIIGKFSLDSETSPGGEHDKKFRRFFTKWHEIAHMLTLNDQLELPFHRSTIVKDAKERLMDAIAGEIGFYEPIFLPELKKQITKTGTLTFNAIEKVRSAVCPEASFQSTFFACIPHASIPVLAVEVGLGYKKHEQEQLEVGQQQLFRECTPIPRLRILNVIPNKEAKEASLLIHPKLSDSAR